MVDKLDLVVGVLKLWSWRHADMLCHAIGMALSLLVNWTIRLLFLGTKSDASFVHLAHPFDMQISLNALNFKFGGRLLVWCPREARVCVWWLWISETSLGHVLNLLLGLLWASSGTVECFWHRLGRCKVDFGRVLMAMILKFRAKVLQPRQSCS